MSQKILQIGSKNKFGEIFHPKHKGNMFVTDYNKGEIFCSGCGLVLEEKILDYSVLYTDYEFFQIGGESTSQNAPLSTLGTPSAQMGLTEKDFNGVPINKDYSKILRKEDKRVKSKTSDISKYRNAFVELKKGLEKLEIVFLFEDAKKRYIKSVEKRLSKGRNLKDLVSASIYTLIRERNIARDEKQIIFAYDASPKSFKRTYRKIIKELGLKIGPASPKLYLPFITSQLKYTSDIKRQDDIHEASKIIDLCKYLNVGKHPLGIAASSLYVNSLDREPPLIQGKLAKVSGVTEVTIRIRSRKMREYLSNKTDWNK